MSQKEQQTQNINAPAAKEKKRSSIGVRIAKYVTALAVVLVLFWFGCTCEVREGETAMIMRFGAVRQVTEEAGLYFKLPWPFETTVTYDGRVQYLESGRNEAVMMDERNIVVSSWAAWKIVDPVLYHNSVGMKGTIDSSINTQISGAINITLGTYNLTDLVSLDEKTIKIDRIQDEVFERVHDACLEIYGVEVLEVRFLRLSLPDATLKSIFDKMTTERQNEINEIIANAYNTANDTTSAADEDASNTRAEGETIAADILAEAETEVARIRNQAYQENIDLYTFLKNLDATIASINKSSTLVVNINKYPFNILLDYSDYMTEEDGDKVLTDLSFILSHLKANNEEDYKAFVDALYLLIDEAVKENDLQLPTDGEVKQQYTVNIKKADDTPLSNLQFYVYQGTDLIAYGQTDAEGVGVIDLLPADNYTIVLSAEGTGDYTVESGYSFNNRTANIVLAEKSSGGTTPEG